MAATDHEKRFLLVALVLSLVAIAVMVGDKMTNSDIAHRQTFDLLELVFASIALVARRGRHRAGCGASRMPTTGK